LLRRSFQIKKRRNPRERRIVFRHGGEKQKLEDVQQKKLEKTLPISVW
jgi:hypothetical protein